MATATGARRPVFRVSLIFAIEDHALRTRIRPGDGGLGEGEPVVGHGEVFRFPVDCVGDEGELDRWLALFRMKEAPGQFLLISDRLTERDDRGESRPSPLTQRVREQFRTSRHLCGLVALQEGATGRVGDVDCVVARPADRDALRKAILRVATGLRLKAPPPARPAGAPHRPGDGVKVEAVQSMEQMERCLALRRRVYGLMGYLPDEVMKDPSGIELDSYDVGSIHFAAVRAGEVVGTVRLVLDLPPSISPSSSSIVKIPFRVLETLNQHARWCESLARRAGRVLWAKVRNCPFMPLPILQSTEFESRWSQILEQTSPGAELSRLVVAPQCRGLRISADLVRATIAKARETRRRVLLLECIPAHEAMYAKYGFQRLPLLDRHGRPIDPDQYPHSRPPDLVLVDQYAVAMRFRLDAGSRMAEVAEDLLAKIRMELSPRFGDLDVPADAP